MPLGREAHSSGAAAFVISQTRFFDSSVNTDIFTFIGESAGAGNGFFVFDVPVTGKASDILTKIARLKKRALARDRNADILHVFSVLVNYPKDIMAS